MSKNKSKKPTIGKDSANPFEKFDSKLKTKDLKFEKDNKNKSRFIKKFKDSDLIHDRSSNKSKKLQLFNLNERFDPVDKRGKFEESYDSESDQSLNSEIEESKPSDAYKDFKLKREFKRKDKEEQLNLLTKLDKQFEELDFSQFYKPTKGTIEYYKSDDKEKKLDKFETTLKELQLNINTSTTFSTLVKEYKSANNISERFEIVQNILKSNHNFPNFARDFTNLCLQSLVEYLNSDDLSQFHKYFSAFSKAFLHLSRRNYREFKSYLEEELLKINNTTGDLYEYLILFLVIKAVEINTQIYNFSLTLLEKYLINLYQHLHTVKHSVDNTLLIKSKLLLLASYNSIIETGYYIPYFYHVCVKLCTTPNIDQDFVLLILNVVKVTLNQLLSSNSYIQPILSLILPLFHHLELYFKDASAEFQHYLTEFREYITNLSTLKPELKSLNIYNLQKLKVQYPKIKIDKYKDKVKVEKERKVSRLDKSEYRDLKRVLLAESLKRAEFRAKERGKKRLESEKRYKEVVRNAMIEQEMLKNLSTSGINCVPNICTDPSVYNKKR